MGQGSAEVGDGVGALCPSCETWWREVDEAWWAHIVEEHPTTAVRLGQVADGSEAGAARKAAMKDAQREAEAAAALRAEVRGRDRAA